MQPPSERLMKAEAPPEPENGGAASAQDNHVFDADTLSIQKGASALVPVLEQQLSAESGYQAELPLHIDTLTGEPLAVTDYQGRVLNTIAFKNETGGPLLAGSVFILDKDNHPMGQNSLPALEAGETAEIPFTPAPEVQLTVSQTVQERERKVRLDDRDGRFDRFLVQGKLSVRNNGDKLRRINVSQPILGQPKITSRARVSDMPSAISGIPQRKLSWNVPVESGGEQTYTFSYEYFVPRN
jgi:hypothetical protein